MSVAPELVWLIERLRRTPSRRQRVRLLLEGWRTLRDLKPADRLLVARELGIDGAEQLVEEIAERRGSSSEEILRALHISEESDASGIGGIMRGLVDPSSRGSTFDRLLGAASTWVADLDTLKSEEHPTTEDQLAPTWDQLDAGSELDALPVDDLEGDLALPAIPPRALEDGAVEVVVEPPVDELAELAVTPDTGVSLDEDNQPDSVELEDEEAADDSEPSGGEVASKKVEVAEAATPPSVAVEPVKSEQSEPVPPTPVRVADVDSVISALASSRSLSGRLGKLARKTSELDSAGYSELHDVLESFPAGWPRRRALETMFRSGLPTEIEVALGLIDSLDRSSERMWALTALIASRELNIADREALLAAADTPTIRRRLGLRLAK
jgi:hypothetical protein